MKQWLTENDFDNILNDWVNLIEKNDVLMKVVSKYYNEKKINPWPWQVLIASLIAVIVVKNT